MKYKILEGDFKVDIFGIKVFRIQALVAFANVSKDELGGYIEKGKNLDQSGNAWVYGNAQVSGDAQVYGNAQVSSNARVYGDAQVSGNAQVHGNARVSGNAWVSGNAQVYSNAQVYGDAQVYGNAQVSGNAWVSGDAQVYGNAWVSGDAQVSGNAQVYGDARVSGNAWVYGDAQVYGNAQVSGDAWVYGNARVYGDAQVYGNAQVLFGFIKLSLKDKSYSLMAQTGIALVKGGAILYKRVNKISEGKYSSCQDSNFIYQDGKIAEVKDPEMSDTSCSTGIHLSTALYWETGDTLIACKVKEKDIITVQQGKVRVKKCLVIGEVK